MDRRSIYKSIKEANHLIEKCVKGYKSRQVTGREKASKWLCIWQIQPLKRPHYPLASLANIKMTKDTQWAGHGKQVLSWCYWVHRLLHTQFSNTCHLQWYKPYQEFPFWETTLTICFSLHVTYKCPLVRDWPHRAWSLHIVDTELLPLHGQEISLIYARLIFI